uniref:Protein prune homolog n=2 Tax=Schistocephalus solidus TaxID=70667 RepID=A0A0X3NMX6_SCHSO
MLANFLRKVFDHLEAFSAKKYVIVTGNEACDLDSIACATAFAYLKQQEAQNENTCYVPVCNIPVEDIPLRTEATHWLNSCRIPPKSLFYHGSVEKLLQETAKQNVDLILVDHHEQAATTIFKDLKITDIIDHHPLSPDYVRPQTCNFFRVERVGSCASLVTDELTKRLPRDQIPLELCQLLYGAIMVDTLGLTNEAKLAQRAMDADFLAAQKLEELGRDELFNEDSSRESIYKQISDAKFCITGLSLWDLLRRDMKPVSAKPKMPPEIVCSTISGMDFQEMTVRQDFTIAANKFCQDHNVKLLVCVTVGPVKKDNRVRSIVLNKGELPGMRRGLAIFASPENRQFAEALTQYLQTEPNELQLQPNKQGPQSNAHHFIFTATINNTAVTRKQIMPILVSFLQRMRSSSTEGG